MEIDNIHVSGRHGDGSVTIDFADITLAIRPEQARELAYALTTEAGRAEEELAAKGLKPCPTCCEYGCPELHGDAK